MIQALTVVYVAATVALAPFFLLMAAITIAAILGRRGAAGRAPSGGAGRSRFLIVIPAHDEQGAVGATVRGCLALDYDRERYSVVVIADNCSDGTAAEAREAGASVVERSTPDRRSKGHALDDFFSTAPEGRPDAGHDATVIVDADTFVDPGLLLAFDCDLARGWDWIQGYYTVSNPDASWRTRMMTYAFGLANGAWMLGLDRLGLGVGLKGNGMCFSTAGLARHPWKAHGLVEDMEFGLMLRAAGERVRFDPGAVVSGEMVSRGGAGAASQRRRWEAGRASLRSKFAGTLARSPSLGPATKALYLLDLFFPPLVTLALGLVGASTIHALAALDPRFRSASAALLPAHGAMLATLLAYAASPILAMGLPARYLASLLALPYYVAWKVGVSLGRGPATWVRTPREPQVPE